MLLNNAILCLPRESPENDDEYRGNATESQRIQYVQALSIELLAQLSLPSIPTHVCVHNTLMCQNPVLGAASALPRVSALLPCDALPGSPPSTGRRGEERERVTLKCAKLTDVKHSQDREGWEAVTWPSPAACPEPTAGAQRRPLLPGSGGCSKPQAWRFGRNLGPRGDANA